MQSKSAVYKTAWASQPEVAFISLGYDNGEIIEMLKDRGSGLKQADFDKVEEIDKKICDSLE